MSPCEAIHTCDMRRAGTSAGASGQITIEREIRDELGIRPKDIAVQRVQAGRIVVEFVRLHEPHIRSLAGILGPSPAVPRGPVDIDDAVALSIAEEWRRSVAHDVSSVRAAASPRRRHRSR